MAVCRGGSGASAHHWNNLNLINQFGRACLVVRLDVGLEYTKQCNMSDDGIRGSKPKSFVQTVQWHV